MSSRDPAAKAQAAGYAWRIANRDANPLDAEASRAVCGEDATLRAAWLVGVRDADLPQLPILSIPDAARLAGMTARYLNDEITARRLKAQGAGKMMRLAYAEFWRWLSVSGRGRRQRG